MLNQRLFDFREQVKGICEFIADAPRFLCMYSESHGNVCMCWFSYFRYTGQNENYNFAPGVRNDGFRICTHLFACELPNDLIVRKNGIGSVALRNLRTRLRLINCPAPSDYSCQNSPAHLHVICTLVSIITYYIKTHPRGNMHLVGIGGSASQSLSKTPGLYVRVDHVPNRGHQALTWCRISAQT